MWWNATFRIPASSVSGAHKNGKTWAGRSLYEEPVSRGNTGPLMKTECGITHFILQGGNKSAPRSFQFWPLYYRLSLTGSSMQHRRDPERSQTSRRALWQQMLEPRKPWRGEWAATRRWKQRREEELKDMFRWTVCRWSVVEDIWGHVSHFLFILLYTANRFLCAACYSAINNLKLKFLFYYCLILLLLIYTTLPDREFNRQSWFQ